jgi:hypothetical protein
MAVHHSIAFSSPLFSQLLDNLVGTEVRRLHSILAESHLRTCEYEDDFFGCGAVATVTEVESERDYCLRHFRAINLNAESVKLDCREPLLKFDHFVLNGTKEERP